MLSSFNTGVLSKFNVASLPPATKRVRDINNTINTLNGTETADNIQFSDILPNVQNSEPVKLLNPDILLNMIHSNAKKYGVDPKLINAVIKNESGYNVNARSSAGAIGLMQLMPDTARSLGVTNINDPAQNVEAGTKYLSRLMKKYNGNIILTLAAYNAGPGAVDNNNGIPPYKETRNYIYNVLTTYIPTPQNT